MSCEICTWAVGDYCLKHKDRDLTPCRDFRGIGAEPKEKMGYIEYLDDTIPEPRKGEDEEEKTEDEREGDHHPRQDLSIYQGGCQCLWTDELGNRRKKEGWLDG